MIRDAIIARLAAAGYADPALTEVPLPGGRSATWVVDLPGRALAEGWTRAREALVDLELYPVAVTTWGERDWVRADLFSRFYYGDDSDPDAIIARAETLSVEEALARFPGPDGWAADNWPSVMDHHLALTEHHYGSTPDRASLADILAGDEIALEGRLMAWEEARRRTRPPEVSESFGWYDPAPHDPVGLVLLPVTEPGHAAAYLSFYGADGAGRHEALVRLMRSWHLDHGARLVASWGTMLQFLAASPPATLGAAFALAQQHVRVAPCTTVLPGEGVRQLARHLWCGERWFLHERP